MDYLARPGQLLEDHTRNVIAKVEAALAAAKEHLAPDLWAFFSVVLPEAALYHDCGKVVPHFQERLGVLPSLVDHTYLGARLLYRQKRFYPGFLVRFHHFDLPNYTTLERTTWFQGDDYPIAQTYPYLDTGRLPVGEFFARYEGLAADFVSKLGRDPRPAPQYTFSSMDVRMGLSVLLRADCEDVAEAEGKVFEPKVIPSYPKGLVQFLSSNKRAELTHLSQLIGGTVVIPDDCYVPPWLGTVLLELDRKSVV